MNRIRKQNAGFTLMELLIVMMVVTILIAIVVPKFSAAIKMAREAALKEDLHVMRSAIDSYTMDKQKAPQTLDDLITDGYLKAVPEDPFTRSKDTWVTDSNGALYSLDQTDPGIDDVHSGSQELDATGQPYSTW